MDTLGWNAGAAKMAAEGTCIMENSTEHIQFEENKNHAVFIFGILLTILGVGSNGFVIFIYLRSKYSRSSSRKSSMKIILNSASTDFLGMACLGASGILFIFDVDMSNIVCFITVSFPIYMTLVSLCVLGTTTLDRYIAICHQQKYAKIMTNRSHNTLLVLAWLIPLPLFTIPLFGFNYWSEWQSCILSYIFHESIFIAQFVFCITILTLTVPLYVPILLKAREFHLRTCPAQFHGINERTSRLKAKRQALRKCRFIGILILTFMLCNLPLSVVRFQLGIGYSGNDMVFDVTRILGILNSFVKPFIYACQNTDFRKEAERFAKCRCFLKVYSDTFDKNRNIQQAEILLSQRPPNTSRNPILSCALGTGDVGRLHADATTEDKTSEIARPKKIYVQPYQHEPITETSL